MPLGTGQPVPQSWGSCEHSVGGSEVHGCWDGMLKSNAHSTPLFRLRAATGEKQHAEGQDTGGGGTLLGGWSLHMLGGTARQRKMEVSTKGMKLWCHIGQSPIKAD
eukprot:GGOE01054635.1.p1 GENE.GGOE01054635.1~~GGOE01054635.1.p1  ORF type:complete len:106 (-),score=2.70 GGOE01054635.1:24-341(-)